MIAFLIKITLLIVAAIVAIYILVPLLAGFRAEPCRELIATYSADSVRFVSGTCYMRTVAGWTAVILPLATLEP